MALAAAEAPCVDAGAREFTCIVLTVPLDHFAPGTATTEVAFAIRRHTAPGDARGVLVVDRADAGRSGIAGADATARELGAGVRARWDVVVPDRRGVGRSGAISCPDAATAWRRADTAGAGGGTVPTPASESDLIAAAAAFSRDCVAETGVAPDTLRFLGTRHAAEDLEALRRYLDASRLMLFGVGDGATLVQQYAAAHPDAVAGLILDSALDPATPTVDRWLESTRAHDNALTATLLACTTTPACARDVRGGDAGAAYDAIARRLADGPVVVTTPGGPGAGRAVTITLADLGRVAAAAVATETDRMLLQRALAAASQDRWWHLARMVAVLDGEASGVSLAARVAIACADQGLPADDDDPAAAWLRLGRESGVADTRLAGLWATDLPCATWPAVSSADSPLATIADPAYPVLVLGATLDPVAPWAGGERIAQRVGTRHGSTILTAGGSHETWGRGRQCPDRAVTAWLSVGREPPAKGACTAGVTDAYMPLAIAARADVGGTRAALASADREIVASVDRLAWDGQRPLRVGCPAGGTIGFTAGLDRTDIVLRACQMTAGVPLTGTGTLADGNGALTLEVASGSPGGTVTYSRSGRGEVSISGRLTVLD